MVQPPEADGAAHPEPRAWQRFYLGYAGRFVEDCVLPLQGGATEVRIAQAPASHSGYAQNKRSKGTTVQGKQSDPSLTGTTVWDGAVVLSHLLSDTPILAEHMQGTAGSGPEELTGEALQGAQVWRGLWRAAPRCLELGAGTGAVSLALVATQRVSQVTITDLADVLPHIQLNVQRNKHHIRIPSAVQIQELRWGPEGAADVARLPHDTPYDLIVGSDLIYYTYSESTPHTKLLLWTLQRLAGPNTVIYLALSLHHNPEEVSHFLSLAQEAFFTQQLREQIPEEWRVPDVTVVRMRLKAAANVDASTENV